MQKNIMICAEGADLQIRILIRARSKNKLQVTQVLGNTVIPGTQKLRQMNAGLRVGHREEPNGSAVTFHRPCLYEHHN